MSLLDGRIGVAIKVLGKVDALLPKEVAEHIGVSVFSNCREQGFTVDFSTDAPGGSWEKHGYHFSWSEDRNSDEIVVYHGVGTDCSFDQAHAHRYTEEQQNAEFSTKTYFSANQQDEAAAFIVDGIRSRVAERVISGTEWEAEPIAV